MNLFEKAAIKAYSQYVDGLVGYLSVKEAIESLEISEATYLTSLEAMEIKVLGVEFLVVSSGAMKEYYEAYCEDNCWIFSSSWLENYTPVSEEIWNQILPQLWENANELIKSCIKGVGEWDEFVSDGLSYAGESLALYDSEEIEIELKGHLFHIFRLS